MEWLNINTRVFQRVCSKEEIGVVAAIYKHWDLHKKSPNRETVELLVRKKPQHKPLLDVLEQYDLYAEELKAVQPAALDAHLQMRIEHWEKFKVAQAFRFGT